jgi:hypothetical protein
LARVDGQAVTVRMPASEPLADEPAADLAAPIPLEGCAPVPLDAGWHELRTADEARNLITSLSLATGTAPSEPAPAQPVPVVGSGDDRRALIDSPEGGLLLFNQGFSPGWVADLDGRSVPASALDTVNAWSIPAGTEEVGITYGPERLYRATLAVSLVSVAVCVALIGWPLRRFRHR